MGRNRGDRCGLIQAGPCPIEFHPCREFHRLFAPIADYANAIHKIAFQIITTLGVKCKRDDGFRVRAALVVVADEINGLLGDVPVVGQAFAKVVNDIVSKIAGFAGNIRSQRGGAPGVMGE